MNALPPLRHPAPIAPPKGQAFRHGGLSFSSLGDGRWLLEGGEIVRTAELHRRQAAKPAAAR